MSTSSSTADVPVNHLDYGYVSQCSNAKELEDIIRVLRSGSQGYYPDLVEFTGKKLKEVNPKSHVLCKDNPAQNYRDLDSEERKAVSDDMQEWMSQMMSVDTKLKLSSESSDVVNGDTLPPVRSAKQFEKTASHDAKEAATSHRNKSVKPREYREWDKFDVEKELKEVDKAEPSNNKVNEVRSNDIFKPKDISAKALKPEERLLRAVKEKEKGNEAFKAKDYEEAVAYYTNSLSYEPTIASYNNRAAAELKLEKYSEAVEDCNQVLKLGPNNIKALLRRGMAFKALKRHALATQDFNSMLNLDPSNKRAKELLAEIEGIERPKEPAGKTAVCSTKIHDKIVTDLKKKGQRLKIIEVDSTKEPLVQPTEERTGDEGTGGPAEGSQVEKNSSGTGANTSLGNAPAKNAGNHKGSGEKGAGNNKLEASSEAGSHDVTSGLEPWQSKDSWTTDVSNAGITKQPVEKRSGDYSEVKNDADQNDGVSEEVLEPPKSTDDISTIVNKSEIEKTVKESFDESQRTMVDELCGHLPDNNLEVGEGGAVSPAKNDGIELQPVGGNVDDHGGKTPLKPEVREANGDSSTGTSEDRESALKDSVGDVSVVKTEDGHTETAFANEQSSAVTGHGKTRSDEAVTEPSELSTAAASAETVSKERPEVADELRPEVKTLMEEGNKLYKMGHFADALLKYTDCVELLWKDREAYKSAVCGLLNNKAACYFRMGDCRQCIRECDQSLELVSDNVRTLVRRGMAYETMEKYAEAFRDFNRVRLLDGSNKLAQEHCSRVIKHLEMLHGKSWRKEIFELKSSADNNQQTLPDIDRTNSSPPGLQSPSKQDEKITSSEQPEVSPKTATTKSGNEEDKKDGFEASIQQQFIQLKERGNSLVKQGKPDEAVARYTDCIKLCPQEVAVYTNRALCYLQLRKYELAEADCNSALLIQNDNIKALFRRAKARKGLGRYRESSEDLIKVLRLDGKNSAAKNELSDVLQLLRKEKKDVPNKDSSSKRKRVLIKDIESDENTPDHVSIPAAKDAASVTSKKTNESEPKQQNIVQDMSGEASTPVIKDPNLSRNNKECPTINGKKSKENLDSNKITKDQNKIPAKPSVKTAYQFLQSWKDVKKTDTAGYLNILKQINLAELKKVISNSLDAEMITTFVRALHLELKSKGDLKFVCGFLQKLHVVERFDMTLLFQSQKEKQALSNLFDAIVKQNKELTVLSCEDLARLRKKYGA